MIEAFAAVLSVIYIVMFLSSVSLPEKPKTKRLQGISVIIAAKDEPLLERTLRSLKKIKKPKIEIIVAASGKETIKTAGKYARKVVVSGNGKGNALNAALKKASYDIVYFLDADSVPESGTMVRICSSLDHAAAQGVNVPDNKRTATARVARLYAALLNNVQLGLFRLTGTTFVSGRNFAVRRSTLKKLGGFRNELTEDMDLSFRLFVKNEKVRFVNARCYEKAPEKFAWYVKQQQRWNAGSGRLLMEWEKRIHHHDFFLLVFLVAIAFMPVLSLMFLLLGVLLGNIFLLSVPVVCFLLCASAATLLDRSDVLLLPVVFPAFLVANTVAMAYVIFSRPKTWYKTPKV